ncbi:solute carrier family 2, facilitated glucose transporter member 3-like [Hippocampus comes]|uniref:solute carrier family 2, facilitated glucose transporter member 3-like n=1 Tax=Hippocampus comes TaxID=109280 RepID=UPI00094ED016|nr:PREDICTED: solute carrier family 2, facilitated glucose transporter member 3-like [Hippocampus comes]
MFYARQLNPSLGPSRRNSILIVNCLSVVGATLMVVSKVSESFETLILGRLLFGLFCGLVMSLNPLYIQEVSPTLLRGAFATLNQVAFASGILLGMVSGLETMLGTKELWPMMMSLSLIPALVQYLVMPFCPESPRYLLINKGQEDEADAGRTTLTFSPILHLKAQSWLSKPYPASNHHFMKLKTLRISNLEPYLKP